jgi:hypothetical protein
VSITQGPLLQLGSYYWFVIRAGWSGLDPDTHVRWAGSIPFDGFGYGERMIVQPGFVSPQGDNFDPGNFLAFEVRGIVPEPSSRMSMFISGLLFFAKRWRRRPALPLITLTQ